MIFAKRALLPTGWAENTRVAVSNQTIRSITENALPEPDDLHVDTLLPALANVHSHTFQRAMAGMTEYRQARRDSFWSWRELMYRFAAHLTPDHIESIAGMVFMEMLEAGYASVGEFHYVHHQADGTPYDNIAELSVRVFAAARESGIGLTHLPVLYSYGGARQIPLQPGQLRFGNDFARFEKLHAGAGNAMADLPPDTRLGIAAHSLRAVSPDDLKHAAALGVGSPCHIHISEQPKEVEDITDWLGKRPVDWLLANADIGPDWCLIHATHMTQQETSALAKTGAVAGLCPITEANLGDGPFNGPEFLESGGNFGIGSDSNIRISLVEELRTLEYSQRLRDLARNVLTVGEGSVGHLLYTRAARGGARALGRSAGQIEIGALGDLIAIDTSGPTLGALRQDQLLDGLIFASGDNVISDVWSAGRHMVRNGRHIAHDPITARYKQTLADLMAVI